MTLRKPRPRIVITEQLLERAKQDEAAWNRALTDPNYEFPADWDEWDRSREEQANRDDR